MQQNIRKKFPTLRIAKESSNGFAETDSETCIAGGQSLSIRALERDDNGRIIRKTETIAGQASEYDYSYDSMGRLLTVTRNHEVVEEYSYSEAGTRIYEMNSLRGVSGRAFTDSDEDHLLSARDTTYQYDYNGFLSTKTEGSDVTHYSYGTMGELLAVTLPDETLIEYVHDPLGRRIVKKVNGTVVEKYLWQGMTRLLAVYDGDDNLVMRFDYAEGRLPVSVTGLGGTYYLIYDQVGSLRAIADASGTVIKAVNYDAFGNIISDSAPELSIPLGFAGGLYDCDTGFVRFGYRDYDPNIGRWTAKDPIIFAGGDTDLYGYVRNNPVNIIDPLGMKICVSWFGPHPRISIMNFSNTELNGTWEFGPSYTNMSLTDVAAYVIGLFVDGEVTYHEETIETSNVVYESDFMDQFVHDKIMKDRINPKSYSWDNYNCIDWVDDMLYGDDCF